MKCPYLHSKFILVEETLIKAKANQRDPKLASMLSGYLIVYLCGVYEDCIEYLFAERAGKHKDTELQSLMGTLMDRQFRNPEYRKIKELVNALNPSHGRMMDKNVDAKSIDAINSIVSNKNSIAHGKTSNATLIDVEGYHNNAVKIFDVLEKILL